MSIGKLKNISSFVLLFCIFLPLSQCTVPVPVPEKDGKNTTTTQYVYKIKIESILEKTLLILAFSWPLIFILISYIFNIRLRYIRILELLFCFGTGYALFLLLILKTKILIGGFLAVFSLLVYFVSTIIQIFIKIKQMRMNSLNN